VQRFPSIKKAISYCGLCGAEKSSGSIVQRTPLSKQRNKHLQSAIDLLKKFRSLIEREESRSETTPALNDLKTKTAVQTANLQRRYAKVLPPLEAIHPRDLAKN
jgi:transposase